MSGTPIGSSKNIGPIEKSEEVAGSSTEISAKLVHHGKQAEKEIKFPAKIEKLSKEEMVMDLKLIHGLALPPKAGINSENTKKPKDSVIEKMNAFIEKVELDDSDHKITTKDLEDGFVIVDKFTQITTEDLEDGFVIINNKNALINDFKAKSEVLGTNYLNKFEFNQLETLNKVVEVVKSGNTEEAKTKLEGLSENLQKTGINKSEADAIKSMLLRENIDRLAPGLNFLNDSQYDYKNDASIKELSTKEFQVFFQRNAIHTESKKQ